MNVVEPQSRASPSEIAADYSQRSEYVKRLITTPSHDKLPNNGNRPPRILVQFWDDATSIPPDVQDCLDSWAPLKESGFQRHLFDDSTASIFIKKHFSRHHVRAFEKCRHPAMRADYFRLCFVLKVGGFYVDADDVYLGQSIESLRADSRLKLQPLCYDALTDAMVDPTVNAAAADHASKIFYVNNNPLIAPAGHPIISNALVQATKSLLDADEGNRDIQALTGPGNLTATLVTHAAELERLGIRPDFELLKNWGSVATSKWPLAYRSGQRNWRHWVSSDG